MSRRRRSLYKSPIKRFALAARLIRPTQRSQRRAPTHTQQSSNSRHSKRYLTLVTLPSYKLSLSRPPEFLTVFPGCGIRRAGLPSGQRLVYETEKEKVGVEGGEREIEKERVRERRNSSRSS